MSEQDVHPPLEDEHHVREQRTTSHRKNQQDEEFSTEVASYGIEDGFRDNSTVERDAARDKFEAKTDDVPSHPAFAWMALLVSIVSFFVWPAVLGLTGAVMGIVAFMGGHRALGVWSMVIGLSSLIGFLFLAPYYL